MLRLLAVINANFIPWSVHWEWRTVRASDELVAKDRRWNYGAAKNAGLLKILFVIGIV